MKIPVMKYSALLVSLFCPLLAVAASSVTFASWRAESSNGGIAYNVEGLPIDIVKSYADSIRVDPFYFKNDTDLLRIGNVTYWTVTSTFNIDRLNDGDVFLLTLDGIDAIAEVYINAGFVGNVSNAFVKYKLDISTKLKAGQNDIKIILKSPVQQASEAYEAYESQNHYAVPPANAYSKDGTAHINMLRKMQASFGWDFAPSFPTSGIGNVEVQGVSAAECRILQMYSRSKHGSPQWLVYVELEVACGAKFDAVLPIYVRLGNMTKHVFKQRLGAGLSIFTVNFPVQLTSHEMWHPNGYGNQVLFDIHARIAGQSTTLTKKIGFRTVKLVESPLQPKGNSYYFEVNSVPVFLKGSNWVQASPFTIPQTCGKTRHFFEAMKAANFNALRVWGGGKYERNCFYDLADAYGILIWQDFMFACNLYPVDSGFKNNVRLEVEYQLKRLLNHPSILLFAGNNELEAALAQHWYPEVTERNNEDYFTIFNVTIAPIVQNFTQDIPYIMTSPSNGINSCGEDRRTCVSAYPMSDFSGDIHQYNYDIDPWDWRSYPTPRLTSEFGFQAMPSPAALLRQIPLDQFYYVSPELERRQHHPSGYQQIEGLISQNLKLPQNKTDLLGMIYLSQLTQAMGIRTQTEHYRRFHGRYLADGRGGTMGTLYWQLNDVWAAPSWASINIDLDWKILHYHAREFFAPNALTVIKNGSCIEVYLAKDRPAFGHANLTVTFFGYSVEPLQTVNILIAGLDRAGTQLIHQFENTSLPQGSIFLTANLALPNGQLVTPEYQFYLEKVKDLDWSQFGKGTKVENQNKTSVTFRTENIVPFMWIVTDTGATWSRNGFTLAQKELTLTADKPYNNGFVRFLSEPMSRLILNVSMSG